MTDKKIIEVDAIKIAYYLNNESKKNTIVFLHGNSGSAKTWIKQFNEPLFYDYRIIVFDLIAHGESDGALNVETQYAPKEIGKVMSHALKELVGNNPYMLIGLSLGACIIAEMINYSISPIGIALTSPSLNLKGIGIDRMVKPNPTIQALFSDSVSDSLLDAYISSLMVSTERGSRIIEKENYLLVKPPFRSVFAQYVAKSEFSQHDQLLADFGVPVFVCYGKEDALLNFDFYANAEFPKWNSTVYEINNAGHLLCIDNAVEYNKLLLKYISEMFAD